jgi:hypothetical protein
LRTWLAVLTFTVFTLSAAHATEGVFRQIGPQTFSTILLTLQSSTDEQKLSVLQGYIDAIHRQSEEKSRSDGQDLEIFFSAEQTSKMLSLFQSNSSRLTAGQILGAVTRTF